MSRRSLVLMLALLPLTTIGAVICALPIQIQSTVPPRDTAATPDEDETGRSALDADATPPGKPDHSQESKRPGKDSQDRDSPRSSPVRPDADETAGATMFAIVAVASDASRC